MLTVEAAYERLWTFLVRKLQEKVNSGTTQTALAESVGVKQPTIHRWLQGDRGRAVSLFDVLKIIDGLEVTVSELAEALDDEDLALLLAAYYKNKDSVMKFASIIHAGGAAQRKIDGEIDFIHERLKIE